MCGFFRKNNLYFSRSNFDIFVPIPVHDCPHLQSWHITLHWFQIIVKHGFFFIKKKPCIIHDKLWYFGARKSILVLTLMQFCIIKDRNVTSSYSIFISLACFFVLLIHNEFTLLNKQRNQCEGSHYVLHTKLQLLSF